MKYNLLFYLLAFALFISSCAKKDEELVDAVSQNNLSRVQYLINQGYSVEARSADYLTPLMIASLNGQKEISSYLILHGAKLNATERHGLTALHLAAQEGHSEIVKLLVNSGANINARDNAHGGAGWPALFYAVQGCQSKSVEVLILASADVNVQMEGVTPLYLAAYHKCNDVVSMLLEKGADPNLPTKIGETSIELARSMKMKEIITLMENSHINKSQQTNNTIKGGRAN